jgi:hypothetical protein
MSTAAIFCQAKQIDNPFGNSGVRRHQPEYVAFPHTIRKAVAKR